MSQTGQQLTLKKYGQVGRDEQFSLKKYGQVGRGEQFSLKKYGQVGRDEQFSLKKYGQVGKDEQFSLKKYGQVDRDEQFSLLQRLQCAYSFGNLPNRFLASRKCGILKTRYPLWSMVRFSLLQPDYPQSKDPSP